MRYHDKQRDYTGGVAWYQAANLHPVLAPNQERGLAAFLGWDVTKEAAPWGETQLQKSSGVVESAHRVT